MSKIDEVYDNFTYYVTAIRFNNRMPIGNNLTKEEFIEKLLTDDDFNNSNSNGCTIELTEEEKLTSPPGHKRKLID
jgi:hypothetical protein